MDLTTIFVNKEFLLLSLAIAIITEFIRRIVDHTLNFFNKNKDSKFWRDVVLPSLPIIIGLLFAYFAIKYPYPQGLDITSGRFVYCAVAGAASGIIYRIVKSIIFKTYPDLKGYFFKDDDTQFMKDQEKDVEIEIPLSKPQPTSDPPTTKPDLKKLSDKF
jgi:uncharacterized protein YacL